jgi:GntR family transcriptional regulator
VPPFHSDVLRLGDGDRRRDIARRVRDILCSEIGAFQQRPVRLPDERAITAGFGVSRNVVRESLQLLADEDRVDRARRTGTITRATPPRHSSDRLLDFTIRTQDEPVRATAQVIGFRLVTEIPVDIWRVFELPSLTDRLAMFERRSIHEGEVRGLHTYYVPLRRNESMTRDDVAGDIYGLIETRFGRRVHSAMRAVSAIAADASSASLLETAVGAPLLFTESVVRAENSEVLMINYSRVRHDKLTLTFLATRESSEDR